MSLHLAVVDFPYLFFNWSLENLMLINVDIKSVLFILVKEGILFAAEWPHNIYLLFFTFTDSKILRNLFFFCWIVSRFDLTAEEQVLSYILILNFMLTFENIFLIFFVSGEP